MQASGQTYTRTTSGYIDIASVMNVSVSGGATIAFNDADDYANGKTMSDYATCTIKSNTLWLVSVRTNSYFFTAGSGGTWYMPASILSIRKAGTSTFSTISSWYNVSLASGSRTGGAPFYTSFDVDLKANPGFNYSGGTYSIGLIYTITAQ